MRDTLRSTFLLSSLTERDFEDYMEKATIEVRKYERGDMINDSDKAIRSLGFIISGKVAVYKIRGGKKSLLNRFERGGTFGAASLFSESDSERMTEIIAETACEICFIGETDVKRIITDYPEAAMSYISFLAGRIRFLNERIDSYTTPTAEAKVAKFLLAHSDGEGNVDDRFNMKQLSSLLGLGRASLYRVLDELEDGGYISRKEGKIKIKNTQDLERKIKK